MAGKKNGFNREMYSKHNERKPFVNGRFIRILKNEISK